MSLTIKEKQHWKDRISARIQKAIEQTYLNGPTGFKEDVKQQAKTRAIESLGIQQQYERVRSLEQQRDQLQKECSELNDKMLERISASNVQPNSYYSPANQRIDEAIRSRATLIEQDVLAGSETGREILRLRNEQEQLLDTVWLATSPIQIRNLWVSFNELVGDQPTELQKQTLCEQPTDSE